MAMAYRAEKNKIVVDKDEEITTVIDHLRRMHAGYIVLVVPQRALILQSIVNLKLLAQEVQRMKKKISISTRDEYGLTLAGRAGIETLPFVTGEDESMVQSTNQENHGDKTVQQTQEYDMYNAPHVRKRDGVDIGSQSFYTSQKRASKDDRGADLSVVSNNDQIPLSHLHEKENGEQYYRDRQHSINAQRAAEIQARRDGVLQPRRIVIQNTETNSPSQQKTYSFYENGAVTLPDPEYVSTEQKTFLHSTQQASRDIEQVKYANDGQGKRFDVSNIVIPNIAQERPRHSAMTSVQHMKRNGTVRNIAYRAQENDDIIQYEKSLARLRVNNTQPEENHYVNPHEEEFLNSGIHQRQYVTRSRPDQADFVSGISCHVREKVNNESTHNQKKDHVAISSYARLLVRSLMFGGVFAIAVIVCIVIAPKTTITVTPKNIVVNDTVEVTARMDQVAVDADRRLVPARAIERDITFVKSFSATGTGDVSAQKAQGTITIYNMYDHKPQPLVASTRFLSENGTLFRLVKATIVPGMKDGEAGVVDALVIADKEGADGNIGPGRFSIPGFDGSPKKEKFYAVNTQSMVGGGTGGSGVSLVSEDDIARAQKEMESEVRQYVHEQLSALIRPESEVLLLDAIVTNTVRSESSMSAQTMSEQFMYEIVVHAYAMVFMQEDVKNILMENNELSDTIDKSHVDMQLSFKNVRLDPDNNEVKFNAQGNASIVASVALDAFKNDIIGEQHDNIHNIIERNYKESIEKVTIESIFPSAPRFLSERISRFSFMTHISIEKSGDTIE